MKIVSACLCGINCNYKGQSKPNQAVINMVKAGKAIPICPEILGGLSTPRTAAEQRGDKVFTKNGVDVTAEFERGSEEGLKIAKLCNCKEGILKARSPSCGCGKIYDGNFSEKLIDGDGVFTKLLKKNGIKVITEEDLK
jgi:uncharacterized protein YbbK (DUF523 family)